MRPGGLAAARGANTGCLARREQLARLAVHVEIASRINKATEERALTTLGKLEQDLVFGDATSKEVIAFLAAHGSTPAQEKVRGSGHRGLGAGLGVKSRVRVWAVPSPAPRCRHENVHAHSSRRLPCLTSL